MKLVFSRQIFEKILNYQVPWKSVEWEPSFSMRMDTHTHRQTDGQKKMTELTVAVCNFANVPLERQSQSDCQHLIALILLLTFPRTFPLSRNTTSHNMCCDNGEVLINVIELTLICCQECIWLHELLKRSYCKARKNKHFL